MVTGRQRILKWNRRCRKLCYKAIKSQWFHWLVIILVLFNTAVLSTEHYGQPYWLDEFQGICCVLGFSGLTVTVSLLEIAVKDRIARQSDTMLQK